MSARIDVDAGGEYTRLLEGGGVNFYPEPAPHRHICPDCGDDWSHSDELCSEDGVADPWYSGQTSGGYASCPECSAPGSNGSLWRFCSYCFTRTLADPSGAPGCCGIWRAGCR